MRLGLAIDASCDLPPAFVEAHGITVLPARIKVDDRIFEDHRDPEEIIHFRTMKLGDRKHAAETYPSSVEEMQQLFLEKLVLQYDCVFCFTVTANRSPTYAHVIQASYGILKHYRQVRETAGVTGPFLLRVIDTENVFAGSAPVVFEAMRMIAAAEAPVTMREHLISIARNTYSYLLPRDLYYIRARAKRKGEQSVGLFTTVLGSVLDIKSLVRCYRGETAAVCKIRGFEHCTKTLFGYVAERVRAGLLTPVLCISYGGDLNELAALPGYADLVLTCHEHGVTVRKSPMSITGMVNVGEGAISVGFAATEHEAAF